MNQLCQTQLNYCSMKRLLCTMIMQFRVSVYCVIFYTQNSACATIPGNSYYFTDLGVDLQNVPTALFQKRSCSLKLVKNYFLSGHGQPDRCWYIGNIKEHRTLRHTARSLGMMTQKNFRGCSHMLRSAQFFPFNSDPNLLSWSTLEPWTWL